MSWAPVGDLGSLTAYAIAVDELQPGGLYVGVEGQGAGVYWSSNNGQTWVTMNTGMGSRGILSLYANGQTPQSIYAGTSNSGIWKYTVVSLSEDYGVSINDAALYTNNPAVTLSLTARTGTTDMQVSNDGGFADAVWEPLAKTKSWTITDFNNLVIPRTVYVKYRTNGQISGVYQDDIILDQTSPTGSLQIETAVSTLASGLSLTPEASSEVHAPTQAYSLRLPLLPANQRDAVQTISLLLLATDDVSGVSHMLLSTDANFAKAEWQAYAPRLDWPVEDKGDPTIYVKYRDRAGNVSSVYSANAAVASRE
jgi:hypothetical protein